ncbi:MAG: hypothetical protein LBD10_14540 [Desulfobulbus sp.]|jgi:hypothetical protein|uniref:hypothetical protein n=1 Tax=Desulfobulbus sp. TaxID=895 RepID=UPI00283C1681|nr:hypothetical protein [Desulfobulbus sp.]MDR2551407.1 hypothetical protein [Desulfobulbus sp.]
MSEIRMPDIVWRWGNAATQGKKPLKIELYQAEQWRHNWDPHKRTMHPHPPLRNREYWNQYYRLRVDGRWQGRKGYKYCFYTLEQAVVLAERMYRERI